MSFDLFYCWANNERVNFDQVKAWAKRIECFAPSETQLWYANPKTGVYFSIDFEADTPGSPDDAPTMPGGYFDSGLSFNLNYNRPRYFAFEALPIVTQLATRFDLRVVDPQADWDDPPTARIADTEALVCSWIDHNERATAALIREPDFSSPLRMAPADSLYLWQYSKGIEDLQRSCGAEIFVPKLVPIRRKGSTHVGTAFTYTQGIPMIVPESEWVMLVRKHRRLLLKGEATEVSVISAQTFVELLTNYMRPYEWPEPHVRMIAPESAEKVAEITGNIERTLPRSEFDVVGRDAFVDISFHSSVEETY